MTDLSGDDARNLTWWQFVLIVIVYAAIIQVGGRIIGSGVDSDDAFATTGNFLKTALIPIALSSVFAIAVATWLGWWQRSSTSRDGRNAGSGSCRSPCWSPR